MASGLLHCRSAWFPKPSTQLFLIAIFIFISASLADNKMEAKQCHWCGPLAEQVHRSRRAPSCEDPGLHVTLCDSDSQYCATVASAPPLIISRLCVKLYQDECYPLYCNTTKTWKMTCPCRGDLCNEAITERENEAFAALTKLVAKTHNVRIKKRFVQEDHTSHIVNNITNLQDIKPQEMENKNIDMKSVKLEQSQDGNMQPILIVTNTVDKINKVNNEKSIDENKIDDMNDLNKPAKELVEKVENKDIEHTAVATVTTPKIIKTEIKQSVTNIKPTNQMPPAESLQQNASPKTNEDQETETTTTDFFTTTMSTTPTSVAATTVTTVKPMEKKNYGVTPSCNVFILLVNCVMYLVM